MSHTPLPYLPLGRMFGFLTKQYIGIVSRKMENTPIHRYYYPLYIIGKNSGKISQQQLSDQVLIDKVSLVRILDGLTDDGLIERKTNPKDRRQHLLSVTSKGLPWIEIIEQTMRETDQLFLDLVSESGHDCLKSKMTEMFEGVKEIATQDVELIYKKLAQK